MKTKQTPKDIYSIIEDSLESAEELRLMADDDYQRHYKIAQLISDAIRVGKQYVRFNLYEIGCSDKLLDIYRKKGYKITTLRAGEMQLEVTISWDEEKADNKKKE